MFIHTTNYELLVIIALPIVFIIQIWTLVIFHKNKSRWRAYDIPIVAILVESTMRNIAIAVYIGTQKIAMGHQPSFDYCDLFAWTFNSTHTFHASCLATLSVIGVFSIKLFGKQENLRQYLTATHVIYHLFCLTTLCACVGVAAILAKPETYEFTATFDLQTFKDCDLLPFQLDMKYNAFIIILHTFLAMIGVMSQCYAAITYIKVRRRGGFDYRQKSTSDLSELSLSTTTNRTDKGYYDTYTIQRNNNGYTGYDGGYATMWKGDFSQGSTTVSSTNSRRPLNVNRERKKDEYLGTGLETINPILIVCYLFYHFPIIILCIFPSLVNPWPVSNIILWLGLLQDLLIPISLGIVDSRFNNWVSRVYRCSEKRHVEGKLPHMGLDGKFRHFSTSQPQSLEINQMHPLRCYQQPSSNNNNSSSNNNNNGNPGNMEVSHHKFPLTNGSLYTSIDGRVPVIHNYRRHQNQHDNRGKAIPQSALIINTMQLGSAGMNINLNLHSANLQRPPTRPHAYCQNFTFPTLSETTNATSSTTSSTLNDTTPSQQYQQHGLLKPYLKHVSLSQNSLKQIPLGLENTEISKRSKSYESLTESKRPVVELIVSEEEEDEYNDYESTSSSFSITTEANGDFEFFHKASDAKKQQELKTYNEYRIKRSNSKRSLENLQAYIDEDYFSQQSNSIMTSDKSLSAEFLHGCEGEGSFLDDAIGREFSSIGGHFYAGSVPDLKKVFISEYL